MRKPGKTLSYIRVNILNTRYAVDVCWGMDRKKAYKLGRKLLKDEKLKEEIFSEEGRNYGITCFRQNRHPFIYIALTPKDYHFWASLTHEAIHAINDIWKYIDEESKDECYAESVGAIVAAVEKITGRK